LSITWYKYETDENFVLECLKNRIQKTTIIDIIEKNDYNNFKNAEKEPKMLFNMNINNLYDFYTAFSLSKEARNEFNKIMPKKVGLLFYNSNIIFKGTT